jgi:hypothetical protein
MGPFQPSRQFGNGGFGGRRTGVASQEAPARLMSPRPADRNGFDFVADAMRLVDLQFQLLTADVCGFWQNSRIAIALLVAGAAAIVAALPVGLFGIAEYLRRGFEIPLEAALLIVAVITLCFAGGLIAWSFRYLVHAAQRLQGSADELRENLRWVRSLLHEEQH